MKLRHLPESLSYVIDSILNCCDCPCVETHSALVNFVLEFYLTLENFILKPHLTFEMLALD
jgi:hypothetical protein